MAEEEELDAVEKDCLVDPPFPLGDIRISAQGINLIPRQDGSGIKDAFDWIGGDYPWMWDFIRESTIWGMSRKFPRDVLSELTPDESVHFLIHPKAIVNDMSIYDRWPSREDFPPDLYYWGDCPLNIELHNPTDRLETCINLPRLVQQAKKEDESGVDLRMKGSEYYWRTLKCGTGYTAKHTKKMPEFSPGIFMRFKIRRFDIVQSHPEDDPHETIMNLEKLGFSFRVTNN